MIKITIQNDTDNDLIDPTVMINSEYGTVFQQWFKGKKQPVYYVSCGFAEENVIQIWYNPEEDKHMLSTDDLKSLKQLVKEVKVQKINATIETTLAIGE